MPRKKPDTAVTPRRSRSYGRPGDFEMYFTNWNGGKIKRTVPYSRLLPGTYNVRRVIWQKPYSYSYNKYEYLVEWEGYDLADASWESGCHVDKNFYNYPDVSEDALRIVSRRFEDAVQKILRSKPNLRAPYFYISFPLDIFRYVFGYPGQVERRLEHFKMTSLCLSDHWYYHIDRNGNCAELSFPLRIEPKLSFRNVKVKTPNGIITKRQPVERIKVNFVINYSNIKDKEVIDTSL